MEGGEEGGRKGGREGGREIEGRREESLYVLNSLLTVCAIKII
jgi:hypothetical protein